MITTVEALDAVRDDLTAHYRLATDLDLAGVDFRPIGDDPQRGLEGTFDGDGHTIRNFSWTTPNRRTYPDSYGNALFRAIGRSSFALDGEIRNLTLENVYVYGGEDNTGGLVGTSYGLISNCHVIGGQVRGGNGFDGSDLGGLVGEMWSGARVEDSSVQNVSVRMDAYRYAAYSTGGLVGAMRAGTVSRSWSSGTVYGSTLTGGLVGTMQGNPVIEESYSRASVNGYSNVGGLVGRDSSSTLILDSYSTGSVVGRTSNYVGGMLGRKMEGGEIVNSYWDVDASGKSTSSGGVGLSTEQMSDPSSYEGWDFYRVWAMSSEEGYPILLGPFQVDDLDTDEDGVLDTADNCPLVANPGQADLDLDNIGDVCDEDDDNDGVLDAWDNCPRIANVDQADRDADESGDVCDDDDDNDTVDDIFDNCPVDFNPAQNDNDGDHEGDVCDDDDDDDTIPDELDNCPLDFNPQQEDEPDADGLGDVCDADDDNDGVADVADNCPIAFNPTQSDDDFDGVGDACDALYNYETVEDVFEAVVGDAADVLVVSNVSGGNGMIAKLRGNGGLVPLVASAVINLASGGSAEAFAGSMELALSKLDAYDHQLRAKSGPGRGSLSEGDAATLAAHSATMRAIIESLRDSA